MESVARTLKTRRQHLEDTGDQSPETTELELILESIRGDPAWKAYAMKLMAQVQGSEELEAITQGQQEGLADDKGLANGLAQGVAPVPPAGMQMPMQPGMPGVPEGGASVTGMGGPQYGQNALAGVVGGGSMAAPISVATQAGGVIPPNLPGANGVV